MKDFDIIDRKYTTLRSVQGKLVALALVLVIAIALHANPALWLWYGGQYRVAILTAAAWPALCMGTLGLLFPLLSVRRGEMSQRTLLVTLVIFGLATVLLCGLAAAGMPRLLQPYPANPGSTAWFSTLQGISLHAALTGYASGFSIGSVLALFFKSSVGSTSKDGESQ